MADKPEPSPELIDAAARGDAEARGELMQHSLGPLRTFLSARMGRALRSLESSADLAQSVCREVLQDLPAFQYRGAGGYQHWLLRRAEHKILKRCRFYRQDKRDFTRAAPLPDAADPANVSGQTHSASRHAMAAEELVRLEQALSRLPPDYREVIVLSRLAGLPHEEIARRMGRTQPAIWTLLSRALARLAVLMEQDRGDR